MTLTQDWKARPMKDIVDSESDSSTHENKWKTNYYKSVVHKKVWLIQIINKQQSSIA